MLDRSKLEYSNKRFTVTLTDRFNRSEINLTYNVFNHRIAEHWYTNLHTPLIDDAYFVDWSDEEYSFEYYYDQLNVIADEVNHIIPNLLKIYPYNYQINDRDFLLNLKIMKMMPVLEKTQDYLHLMHDIKVYLCLQERLRYKFLHESRVKNGIQSITEIPLPYFMFKYDTVDSFKYEEEDYQWFDHAAVWGRAHANLNSFGFDLLTISKFNLTTIPSEYIVCQDSYNFDSVFWFGHTASDDERNNYYSLMKNWFVMNKHLFDRSWSAYAKTLGRVPLCDLVEIDGKVVKQYPNDTVSDDVKASVNDTISQHKHVKCIQPLSNIVPSLDALSYEQG